MPKYIVNDIPAMKALVVVCYQTDHVTGKLGNRFSRMIEKNIVKRIEEALDYNDSIYFVMDSFDEAFFKTLEGKKYPAKICIRGMPGADLYGKVNDYISEGHMVMKRTYGSDSLMSSLKPYDDIEFCGVDTHKSVLANVILAKSINPKARITVRQNCVADKDSELGEAALNIMESMGIEIE